MMNRKAFIFLFSLPPSSFRLALPSVMAYERNKRTCAVIFARVAFISSDDADQSLCLTRITDRDYESSINLQLREQRLWNFWSARRNEYRVVRRVRAPAQCAVETFNGRVVDSKLPYARLRLARQIAYALDCINLRSELREHSRLIA